jgi:hypothetical protein
MAEKATRIICIYQEKREYYDEYDELYERWDDAILYISSSRRFTYEDGVLKIGKKIIGDYDDYINFLQIDGEIIFDRLPAHIGDKYWMIDFKSPDHIGGYPDLSIVEKPIESWDKLATLITKRGFLHVYCRGEIKKVRGGFEAGELIAEYEAEVVHLSQLGAETNLQKFNEAIQKAKDVGRPLSYTHEGII